MPHVFKRADIRFLAAALAEGTSHATMANFAAGYEIVSDGNKIERATTIVMALLDLAPEASNAAFIDMLDFLYVEQPASSWNTSYEAKAALTKRVLAPRGIELTEEGYKLPHLGSEPAARYSASAHTASTVPIHVESGSRAGQQSAEASEMAPNDIAAPREHTFPDAAHTVFLVHGRDGAPVAVLKQYLMFLGLRVMPWSEARRLTGKTQPHTYDIVEVGIRESAAVIVLFSPDDLARIGDHVSDDGDPDRAVQGQARQNVTLEAGLAFGIARDRTIFVQSAPTRPISDIDGFNWVKLDGEYDSRNDLRERLAAAGASLRMQSANLLDANAGPFKVTRS